MFDSFWNILECNDDNTINATPSEDAYSFPECDYELNPTALYKQIQGRNWTSVNQYLLTGYWSGAFFADPSTPKEQACTWVTKYDKKAPKKAVIWTQLPVHAAIVYGAPEGVIQLLIQIAPPCIRCADDQRMLPLHLAFNHGSTDSTLAMILEAFPEAVVVRDFKGRAPADCAEDSPQTKRGKIIKTVLYHNQKAWEKKASKVQEKQLSSIREALTNRNERVTHLETALDLVRCREDQLRGSFIAVVKEIKKMRSWQKEATRDAGDNDGMVEAMVVKELSGKLGLLIDFAAELHAQQSTAKKESDKTLEELRACWNGHEHADVQFRNFEDEEQDATKDEDISVISGATSMDASAHKKDSRAIPDIEEKTTGPAEEIGTMVLKTEGQTNDEAMAKLEDTPALKEEIEVKATETYDEKSLLRHQAKKSSKSVATEQSARAKKASAKKASAKKAPTKKQEKLAKEAKQEDDDTLSIPSEFRNEEEPKKIEEPLEEQTPADAPVTAVEVPIAMEALENALDDKADDVGSIDKGSTVNLSLGIENCVSDMTSIDDWDGDSSKGSKGSSKLSSFRKRLKKITKRASKAAAALEGELPPKVPMSVQGKSGKRGMLKLSNVKVNPTM